MDRLFESEGRCIAPGCPCGGRLLAGHRPLDELEAMAAGDDRDDPGVRWLVGLALAAAAIWVSALALLGYWLASG